MDRSRFAVSIRFSGQKVDPEQISGLLGLTARCGWKAGEPRFTPDRVPLPGVHDTGYCTYRLEPHDEELADFLENTLTRLAIHKQAFAQIRAEGGRIEFFIGWFSDSNTGETFTKDLLAKMADLQIDLSLDIYAWDESSDHDPND